MAAAKTGEPIVITSFQAENYKRLKAVHIEPNAEDGFVVLLGKNAAGKSSCLDAIMAVLGGKSHMPSQPVRKGEEDAAIEVTLSNGITARRIINPDGTGSIVVENAEGARFPSPQAVLDKLYSSVAFDPIGFTRLEPKDQLATLRRLVQLDVDLDALAKQDKDDYEARRDVNRDLNQIEAQLAGLDLPAEKPTDLVDEDAILQQITEASETNAQINQRAARRAQAEEALKGIEQDIFLIEEQISGLQHRLKTKKEERARLAAVLQEAEALPELADTAELQARLSRARELRAIVAAFARRDELTLQIDAKKKESQAFTDAILARGRDREKAMERANMPVAGLSFGEGEVLFNGLPLDQASSAEKLRISVAIGIATSPELQVMLVRDASLLDADGFKQLAELGREYGFQLWVESVETADRTGIIIVDGEIAGAEAPEPIERPKKRSAAKPAGKAAPEAERQDEAPEQQKPADALPGGSDAPEGPRKTLFERMSEIAKANGKPDPAPEPDDEGGEEAADLPTPAAGGESMFD